MCGPAATAVFSLIIGYPTHHLRAILVHEGRVREFLGHWGPTVGVAPEAGEAATPDFAAQCEAMLEADPRITLSIMGLYPEEFVAKMKARGIAWWATATTVAQARAAVAAGADVIVAQGAEAGGHRGAFNAAEAELRQVGLIALLPAIVNAVDVPVVATGGIADARGVAAASCSVPARHRSVQVFCAP